MTQAPDNMEDPVNLGGGCGWASSTPLPNWSTCHRRRRGAPMYKRRQRYGPKAEYEPPRKQPKYHYGRGPWFQPPRRPAWAMYSHWGHWGGPWHPPPATFRKPPRQVQVIRVYGLPPFCLCCCSCWCGSWNPGWMRPPGRKKRWGRRGRWGRHSRRPLPRNPPAELNKLLRPVNMYGWQAPGMRAPPNTTQFIMNQIYEDMRQQEKLDRQQEALRMQQAQAGGQASPAGSSGNEVPPIGGEEETFYGFAQNPSLLLSPAPEEEMQSLIPQLEEEEEEEEKNEDKYDKVVYNGREESEEEETEEESEDEEEEEVEEADFMEEGQEREEAEEEEGLVLQEDEQREEENPLPLEMPLSVLVGDEEEREDFVNYAYFSPEQINSPVATGCPIHGTRH